MQFSVRDILIAISAGFNLAVIVMILRYIETSRRKALCQR